MKRSLIAALFLSGMAYAQQPVVPGSILGTGTVINSTNGTLNATFSVVTNTAVPAVLVELNQGNSITAGAINFKVSYDGTNYVVPSSDAIVDPTSSTSATISMPYALQALTQKSFLVLMKGAQSLQIQMSTAMTGTGSVTPFYSLLPSLPSVPIIANAGTGNFATNLAQVNSSTVSTAATGVQKVGIVGNAGASTDSARANSSSPTNSIQVSGTYDDTHISSIGHSSSLLLEETGALSVQAGAAAYPYWTNQTFTGALATTDFQVGSPIGSLFIQFSGITGSPSGCTLTSSAEDNGIQAGNTVTIWMTSLTVANGAAYYAIYPNQSGSNAVNIGAMGTMTLSLTCSVYPSAGTVTAVFMAAQAVTLAGANGNAALVDSSGNLDVNVQASGTLTENVAQVGGSAVSTAASGTQLVGVADGAGNKLTSNSTTFTSKFGLDSNLLGTLGTAFSTAGKVDIKAADGDVATLGAKADAKSTATDTTAVSIMQVLKEISAMEQAPASRAVTNAGTFAVQDTLQAGSAIAGKFGIDQTTPGTTNAVTVTPSTSSAVALTAAMKATLTTAVNVKASAGNVYAMSATNGAASICWVQFLNSAGSGTLGTAVIFSIPLPASGTVNLPVGAMALSNFSTGIAVGIATTATGSSACGTAGNVAVFYN